MNQYRRLNKIFAALSFVAAFVTYYLTLQPSVPFWDCGEFSAAAMWQQVPHPPGAPLWLMVAKTFEVFLGGDPGHNFNVFAAFCAALAALFTYLIAVNAVERFNPYKPGRPISAYITTYGAGLIGALAFVWSDSNWFNSVESEVYSAATFLTTLVMWLMMKWDQEAERSGHERWLLLMAYVIGLSIGVHLLALLVIPSVALTIYFRRYKKPEATTLLIALGIMGAAFFVLYNSTLSWIPALLSASSFGGIILLGALVGLAIWAYTDKKAMIFLTAMSFTLVILGYTTYTHIMIRSAAHPVMNENVPDNFNELRRYLGREQYGDRPHWPRRVEYDGYKGQAMAKYGDPTPPTGHTEDGQPTFDNVNFGAEINYMIQYQVYEMYLRYLLWNFAGRVSDMQDADVSWIGGATAEERQNLIRPSGATDIFPITFFAIPFLLGLFGIFIHFRKDWKMATVFMTAFLFLGVLAALQQRQQDPQPRERDYFYAGSFMIFAIWVGFGALGLAEAAGANRSQKREEEGINGGGINVGVAGAVIAACFIGAPVNMAIGGWKLHNRSGNWLPWDYAYNILQSCEKNSILFTNGDNDTFPLWYLQDVAGVRRDIRVVNLELAQTPWYLMEMKKEATWDAPPVPMTFPEQFIQDDGEGRNGLRGLPGDPSTVSLPVPANVISAATKGAASGDGTMEWPYTPTGDYQGQKYFTPKNQIVRSIVEQVAREGWKRPIFFSLTAGNEFAGLEPFLRSEGMTYHVMPVRQSGYPISKEVMRQSLVGALPDNEYHTEQHYGFKFRGLNDPGSYFLGQDDHRRPINYFYHRLYIQLAEQSLYVEGDRKGAIEALNKMIEVIPPERFGPPSQYGETYGFLVKIATMYRDAGDNEKAKVFAQRVLDILKELKEENFIPRMFSPEDTPAYATGVAQSILGNYSEALSSLNEGLAGQPNNQNYTLERDAAQIAQMLAKGDTEGAKAQLKKVMSGFGPAAVDARRQILATRFPTLMSGIDTSAPALPPAAADTGKKPAKKDS